MKIDSDVSIFIEAGLISAFWIAVVIQGAIL